MSYSDDRFRSRVVKSLESIAKSIDHISKRLEYPNLPTKEINTMVKAEQESEKESSYIDLDRENLIKFDTLNHYFSIPIYIKKEEAYKLTTDSAIKALRKELIDAFLSVNGKISFDYAVLNIRKNWDFPDEYKIFVDVDFYVINKNKMVYAFRSKTSLYDYLMED